MWHSLLFFFAMSSASTSSAADWESIAPLPVPNGGGAAGTVQGKIVIAGGTTWKDDVKVWLDDIWTYDPATNRWSETGSLPNPLAYGVAAETPEGLLIAGGFDGQRARTEVVRLAPPGTVTVLPQKLAQPSSLAVGGLLRGHASSSLFVFGGSPDPAKLDAILSTGQRVPLREGESTSLTSATPPHLFISSGAVCGNSLYVFTTARATSPTTVENISASWVFDLEKQTWSSIAPYPMALRGVTALRLDDTHIYVAGGYGGEPEGFRSEAFIYDTTSNTYSPAKPLPITAMVSLVSDGTHVYCLGGEDAKKHRTDRCWRIPLKDLLP